MTFTVRRHDVAARFVDRARAHLLEREIENNLLLDLAGRLAQGAPPPGTSDPYMATLEEDGRVVGCALRTPPWKLVISPMPDGAVDALVEDVGAVFRTLPAVLGRHEVAGAFARGWQGRTGRPVRAGDRQRIWALEEVVPPPDPPAGRLRPAVADDLSVLQAWMAGFRDDTGLVSPEPAADEAARRIASGDLYVWDDRRRLRGMGALAGRTPSVTRVGLVYTPPGERGKGYASVLVAALSRAALDAGARRCSLYTQLSNPVSNAIYARLGYRPVADHTDWHLEAEQP